MSSLLGARRDRSGDAERADGTAAAPLLYWLAVVSGLVGLTFLRLDDEASVVPIWFGAVVGVALGQLVAVLRIRLWVMAVATFVLSWLVLPLAYFSLVGLFGPGRSTEIAAVALAPALLCGYASLTERGGLLAFWYPAMLWMLVILEGEAPDSFAPRGSLPFILGLAALFVAYLRARESRRVALWRTQAIVGLATPAPRTVLGGSPARGLAQLAWNVAIGGGALLLTIWIAPKLWEKDHELQRQALLSALEAPPPPARLSDDGFPCCPDDHVTETTRFREYMPLRSSREEARRRRLAEPASMACSYCAPPPSPEQLWYAAGPGVGLRRMDAKHLYGEGAWPRSDGLYAYVDDNDPLAADHHRASYGASYAIANNGWAEAETPGIAPGYPLPSYAPPAYVAPEPPPPPTPAPKPVVATPPKPPAAPVVATPPKPAAPVVATPPKPPAAPVAAPPPTAPLAPVAQATPPPNDLATKAPSPMAPAAPVSTTAAPDHRPTVIAAPSPSFPWRVFSPLVVAVMLLPVLSRLARRIVTLRHLARPFWNESVEQRISNHWERALISLRDAGIEMRKNEQPGAFARRVGVEGMKECAEVLERVRHGVRIEEEDLGVMAKSADAVVATARRRAGLAGRLLAAFRPLA